MLKELHHRFVLSLMVMGMFFSPGVQADSVKSKYALTSTQHLMGSTKWDYLTFDPVGQRLFITRGNSVDVLDTNSKTVMGTMPNLDGVHGVTLVPSLNKGFISEGKSNRVTVFDTTTLNVLTTLPVGQKPDAILYDSMTRRVFVADGDSNDLSVIDAKTNVVIGTIKLNGAPEFAVVDGKGHLYINIEDKSQMSVVNTKTMKVTGYYNLTPGCDGPTGLAIDPAHHLLFSTCANKHMMIVNARNGKIIDVVDIGAHSDAAAFDPTTGLAFSSNGDGTLTVVDKGADGHYRVIQSVPTKVTARTMALNPTTHEIYLSAAETDGFDPPTEKHPESRPHVKPDTFMILTVSPTP